MAQEHLDRLTAIDASFLHQEGAESHMHVGALVTLEGPPPPIEDFCDSLRDRLHLVPRYRQKLAFPPAGTGRPLWVDDPDFILEYHVRHTALPAPGSEEQLRNLVARIFSQQLDRTKPLWEMWLVEGVAGRSCALITKTHHALIDGIAGVDLATVMFDLTPVPRDVEHPDRPWQPHREPAGVELLASGVRGALRTGIGVLERAVDSLSHPRPLGRRRARGRRGHRRGRVGGAQPRAPDAAQRRRSARTGASSACAGGSRTSSSSRTPSAARSTTSC